MNWMMIDPLLLRALEEDLGSGDVTTDGVVMAGRMCRGRFIAKEDGVICGLAVAQRVFFHVSRLCGEDAGIVMDLQVDEGAPVSKGDILATIHGPAAPILSGERVALNFLQHLSGIATRTALAVAAVQGTKARIADTRKTTPGLRWLEKYAVRTGGGANHRLNLSDGILIKDNHIVAAGGIGSAVAAVRKYAPHTLRVEVEVENLAQVDEALAAGAEILLLDNMGTDLLRAAVERVAGRALTEASGNMGDRDLREVAATGVDYISIGALTHSVRAMDISLRFE